MTKCIICGRKLTSEKSILAGVGSGCRGNKKGRRSKVFRTISFEKGESIILGTSEWAKIGDNWWNEKTKNPITHEDFRKYLRRYDMIIRVEDVSESLWQDMVDGKFDMTKFEEVSNENEERR